MPSLGDELLTNARLVDGGAKVILLLSSSSLSLYLPSSCQSHVVLTTVLQVPFLSAAVWRDGETLEEELMEAVMTDKVKPI